MTFRKSTRILLIFLATAAALLWFGKQPEITFYDGVEADLQAGNLLHTDGVLSIVYSNNEMSSSERHVFFTSDADQLYEVETSQDIQWLNGDRVHVRGYLHDMDASRDDDRPVLVNPKLRPLDADTAAANDNVEGNQKWVNIACRFGDMPDETPQPREYFEEIMLNSAPGMDHYWRQTSAGLVNIEGSKAYGWYNLPNSKSHYERSAAVNVGFALRNLLTHCAQAAVEADQVDFSEFAGINVMLNDTFGCCAWGGRMPLNIDGNLVTFRTTWLPPWAFTSLHVIAHEMGHGWGLPHSSGPYGQTYDSAWDVMSGGTRMLDFCRIGTEAIGCHQVGTIGIHLENLGWIPASRVVTVQPGEREVVTLDALTTVRAGIDDLLVKVPVKNSSSEKFYTVEVRSFVAYDRNVPGEAVVLHEVVPGRASPAHVVDGDNNGDVNDEGAMWLPGETFTQDGVTVRVLTRLGTTFTVEVRNE